MASVTFSKNDFENWERFYRASFFNSLGGYKSLNLMASHSAEGVDNLGLFFSVIHLGANPPLLGMLFRPHTVPRHSLENFRETGFATLNSVDTNLLERAHGSSANYKADESEFLALGIEAQDLGFGAPYVKESPIKIGVSYVEDYLIKANSTIFCVAAIEEVHLIDDWILSDGLIDHSLAGNLTVNGLDSYYKVDRFKRFAYAGPHEELKEMKWDKK